MTTTDGSGNIFSIIKHWGNVTSSVPQYSDVTMDATASQITSVSIVFSNICSKKTSKLRVTDLCEGNSPVNGEFPAQRPVTRKMFPFGDVIMPRQCCLTPHNGQLHAHTYIGQKNYMHRHSSDSWMLLKKSWLFSESISHNLVNRHWKLLTFDTSDCIMETNINIAVGYSFNEFPRKSVCYIVAKKNWF